MSYGQLWSPWSLWSGRSRGILLLFLVASCGRCGHFGQANLGIFYLLYLVIRCGHCSQYIIHFWLQQTVVIVVITNNAGWETAPFSCHIYTYELNVETLVLSIVDINVNTRERDWKEKNRLA